MCFSFHVLRDVRAEVSCCIRKKDLVNLKSSKGYSAPGHFDQTVLARHDTRESSCWPCYKSRVLLLLAAGEAACRLRVRITYCVHAAH